MGRTLNHTGEFFKKRDEWRNHPMLASQFRKATPGLGIATGIFGAYLLVDALYSRISEKSEKASH